MMDAIQNPTDSRTPGNNPAWFCVHTQPKHEHIAAAHLLKDLEIEVYLPRIRFKRSTRRGPKLFTEALFPSYLFARFDITLCLRKVHHARGVCSIVHFGHQWPAIPTNVIEDLRATIGSDHVYDIHKELQRGDSILISGGAFHDLRAVVDRVMPARERVSVLLDFLGRQTTVVLPMEAVVREENHRQAIL